MHYENNCPSPRSSTCVTWVEPPCKSKSAEDCDKNSDIFLKACPGFHLKDTDKNDPKNIQICRPKGNRQSADYTVQLC